MPWKIMLAGIPWSGSELGTASIAARALGAVLYVADTAEELAAVDPALARQVPVTGLTAGQVAEAARSVDANCILSITELSMVCAAEARELLGQPGNPSAAERAVLDKAATRRVLSAAGLTSVRYWETDIGALCDLEAVIEGKWPVVAKPRALTGSAGVRLLESASDAVALGRQYEKEVARRHSRDRLIIESFVAGEEISAEAIAVDGKVTLIALTDKVNTGEPYFIELGHVMPSRHTGRWSETVNSYLQDCVTALGITTAPLHAELKLRPGDRNTPDCIELVELHCRFGGDNIVRLLSDAFGFQAFQAYFAAMRESSIPGVCPSGLVHGIGFFTSSIGRAVTWPALAFPYPSAVRSVDFDAGRQPKLKIYEGVRLLHWRAGEALFCSSDYDAVAGNVNFLAEESRRDLREVI